MAYRTLIGNKCTKPQHGTMGGCRQRCMLAKGLLLHNMGYMQHMKVSVVIRLIFFSLPSWCGGTTVTAARALINSPGHLRKNASSSDYWDYTWSKSALRVRAAASLLSPIAVLQSDYAQVMTTTLTSWTKALAPGVLLSDLWNWEDIYHYVPYFAGAQNTWYPINLNSAAVSLLNTNRGCWLHSGWTQDYVDYGIDYRITNAGVAGIALQVYVV